jgi:hypothetical protein
MYVLRFYKALWFEELKVDETETALPGAKYMAVKNCRTETAGQWSLILTVI